MAAREMWLKALMIGFGGASALFVGVLSICYAVRRILAWIHRLRHPWD